MAESGILGCPTCRAKPVLFDSELILRFRARADKRDATALTVLASCYHDGSKGLKKNSKEAVKLYEQAAQLGHPEAAGRLGKMHLEGDGVKKNPTQAKRYLGLSANLGSTAALFLLGNLLREGKKKGFPQDLAEAAKLYRKAANQGHADSQANLAQMLKTGQVVPQDPQEAERLFKLAADQPGTEGHDVA